MITSPVTLEGTGAAFEAVIGHPQVTGNTGMGNATYLTTVVYTTSFRSGTQEGIVAVYEANGGLSSENYSAVMIKVLL